MREYKSHVFWQRRFQYQFLLRQRVAKGQLVGMERLSGNQAVVWVIQKVSQKGMADVFQMNSDLVSPSGFQSQCSKAAVKLWIIVKKAVMGAGRRSLFNIYLPHYGGAWYSGNGGANDPFRIQKA